MNYTPRPWKVLVNARPDNGRPIFILSGTEKASFHELRADADLMEAAPEQQEKIDVMLSALKSALEELRSYATEYFDWQAVPESTREAIETLKLAIAKAES